MNPTNESIGRAFLSWCSDADSGFSRMIERIMRDARELDRQATGVYADCCDTPEYCSSVRRCTRQDEAAPQPPAQEQGECRRLDADARMHKEGMSSIDRLAQIAYRCDRTPVSDTEEAIGRELQGLAPLVREYDAAHKNLDDYWIDREDESGATLSMWGRILRFLDMQRPLTNGSERATDLAKVHGFPIYEVDIGGCAGFRCVRESDVVKLVATLTRAAGAEDARDAERYRWLRDSSSCSLTINHNDHHCMYQSVSDTMDCSEGYYSDVSEEEKARMIATDSIWTVHEYPNTPVGFNVWHAATLDAAIDAAIASQAQEGANARD